MICPALLFEMAGYDKKENMTDAATAMAHREFENKPTGFVEKVNEEMTIRSNEIKKIETRLENKKEELLHHVRDMLHDKRVVGSERIIESYIETIAEIDTKLNVIRVNSYFFVET